MRFKLKGICTFLCASAFFAASSLQAETLSKSIPLISNLDATGARLLDSGTIVAPVYQSKLSKSHSFVEYVNGAWSPSSFTTKKAQGYLPQIIKAFEGRNYLFRVTAKADAKLNEIVHITGDTTTRFLMKGLLQSLDMNEDGVVVGSYVRFIKNKAAKTQIPKLEVVCTGCNFQLPNGIAPLAISGNRILAYKANLKKGNVTKLYVYENGAVVSDLSPLLKKFKKYPNPAWWSINAEGEVALTFLTSLATAEKSAEYETVTARLGESRVPQTNQLASAAGLYSLGLNDCGNMVGLSVRGNNTAQIYSAQKYTSLEGATPLVPAALQASYSGGLATNNSGAMLYLDKTGNDISLSVITDTGMACGVA